MNSCIIIQCVIGIMGAHILNGETVAAAFLNVSASSSFEGPALVSSTEEEGSLKLPQTSKASIPSANVNRLTTRHSVLSTSQMPDKTEHQAITSSISSFEVATILPSSSQMPMLASSVSKGIHPTIQPGPKKFLFSFKIVNRECTVHIRENDAQTVEYKYLATQILNGVNDAFKNDKTYTGSRLVRFDCGSVIPVVEVSKLANASDAASTELKPIADRVQTGSFVGLNVSSFDSKPATAPPPRLYIKLKTDLSNGQFCRQKDNFKVKLASFIVTSNGFSLIQPSQIIVFGNKCTDASQMYGKAEIDFYVSSSPTNAMDVDTEVTSRTHRLVQQFIDDGTTWRLSAAFDKEVNAVEIAGVDSVDDGILSEMTMVLIGMGATFALLLLIIIIIVIISVRRRKAADKGRQNAFMIGNRAYLAEETPAANANEEFQSPQVNVDGHDYEYPDALQSQHNANSSPTYEDLQQGTSEARSTQQYQLLSNNDEAASKIQIEPEETGPYKPPLSTNLKPSDFEEHSRRLDVLKQEFAHLDYDMPTSSIYPPQWVEKNRVNSLIPRPETRVILGGDSVGIDGYINASHVRDSHSDRKIILTQGPLEKTCRDFWKMVIEQNVHVIVMVVPLVQEGVEKCYQYWPPDSVAKTYGEFEVQLSKKELKPDFTVTTMMVKGKGELRKVSLFRYMSWPENNIPESANSFIRFLLEATKTFEASEPSKLVVHCNDGIGMSAVFVAIANCIQTLAEHGSVDVYKVVKMLREDRAAAVDRFDQYRFVYEALQEYLAQTHGDQQEYMNNSDITSSM